ncbi:hypothetical protein N7540_013024 [Penicillium herquei]|nr:hypothetical protein N7540_013024 [Penicillium herquei]
MPPRNTTGWSEREEERLLPWLGSKSGMTWKEIAHAYEKEFGVDRSVESLRGKKYHILRKRGRINKVSLTRKQSRWRSPFDYDMVNRSEASQEESTPGRDFSRSRSPASTGSSQTFVGQCFPESGTHKQIAGGLPHI